MFTTDHLVRKGDRPSYKSVADTLTVQVIGADKATVLSNINDLVDLFMQSIKHQRGDDVAAVKLQVGTGVSKTLACRVEGKVSDEIPLITMPDYLNELPLLDVTVEIRFLRTPLFLSETADAKTSGTFSEMDTEAIPNFTNDLAARSPVDLRLQMVTGEGMPAGAHGYLMLCTTEDDVFGHNAENPESGSDGADITYNAHNNEVRALTPTTITTQTLEYDGISTVTTAKRWAMAMSVLNESTTIAYEVTFTPNHNDGGELTYHAVIPAGHDGFIFFDLFLLDSDLDSFKLEFLPDGTSASDRLLIDQYAFANREDENLHIVEVDNVRYATDEEIKIEHRTLTERSPRFYTDDGTLEYRRSHFGNIYWEVSGDRCALMVFMKTKGLMVLEDDSGGSVTLTATVTRSDGYFSWQ
jgi:hypothetical protein